MIVKTHDTTGRTMYQEVGDPLHVALAKALLYFLTWTQRAWWGAIYEYKKARFKSLPFHSRNPIDDPLLTRVDDPTNPDVQAALPQDEPSYTVYRTESGRYFTPSMLTCKNPDPALIADVKGSRITQAADISDERASMLVDELDALELDTELDENEKLLRQACRAHLAGLAVR